MKNQEFQHISDKEIAHIRSYLGDNPLVWLDVMRECVEVLGVVSKSDYSAILDIPKRTVQDGCRKGRILSITISGVRYPCINE